MEKDNPNSGKDNVSRRKTLSVLGSSGALLSGIAGVPDAVVGDSGRKQRITILAQRDEAHETVKVSKKWYAHKDQATKVKNALRNQFLQRNGIHSIGIGHGSQTVGGLESKKVIVTATPDAPGDVTTDIPSSVKGIPVATQRSQRPVQTDCYTGSSNQGDGDLVKDVHGGMAAYGEIESGTTEDATLCCRVYKNGTKYMLGCRHMLNGDPCAGSVSDKSWGRIDDSGDPSIYGGVEEAHKKLDTALLTLDNPDYYEHLYDITEEPSGGIIGRVTSDGIDYLHTDSSTSSIVRKRGRITCDQTGTIEKVRDDLTVCDGLASDGFVEENQIVSTTDQKKGDSGGPVYIHRDDGSNPDDLYLLHIATRKTPDYGYARGSSAEEMSARENITFGGNPYNGE